MSGERTAEPLPDVIKHVPATGYDEGLARAERLVRNFAGAICKANKWDKHPVTDALFDVADEIGSIITTKPVAEARSETPQLVADRDGVKHDPAEVADRLDAIADRSDAATGEALHDAADVVRALAAQRRPTATTPDWAALVYEARVDAFEEAAKVAENTPVADRNPALVRNEIVDKIRAKKGTP